MKYEQLWKVPSYSTQEVFKCRGDAQEIATAFNGDVIPVHCILVTDLYGNALCFELGETKDSLKIINL